MKYPRYSEKALKTTLRLCAGAVVICVLAVGLASAHRTAAQHRSQLAAQSVRSARARLERANEDQSLIDSYRDRYEQLKREGLTIRFDRAVAGDWFEAAIRARHGGMIDSYVIGKDALFAGPETAGLTAFRVVSHRLDFNATAADEDEFADLMTAVEKRLPGTTAQEACSVSRNSLSRDAAAALNLHCALVWYEFAPSNIELAANEAGT
jgi:hypothetical protein